MELRHLRYFVAAAEEEHFGRASNRLHVTRPAVSQMIADLEDELGTPLFERLAQRVRLTAAGKAMLPPLQALLNDLGQAVALARRVGAGKSGTLVIGYGSLTLLHPIFRAAIKLLHERAPDLSLSLVELPTSQQRKALADGRIHAGFMHFGPDSGVGKGKRPLVPESEEAALDLLRIQTGALGVVMPNDHPLAKRKSVDLVELASEPFVVVPNSSVSPGYGPLYSLCQQAGFQPRIVQEVNTIAAQLNLVSVGMGIGLTVTGKNFIYPQTMAVIPLKGVKYTTTFALGWVKGRSDPALDYLVDVVSELAA